jgi:hypothetical protein
MRSFPPGSSVPAKHERDARAHIVETIFFNTR